MTDCCELADTSRGGVGNSTSPAIVPVDGGIRLPWAAVVYEGRYLIRVHSIDRNWYDLIRSSPEFGGGQGFGGNAGDSFDRPIFHVEGGVGLFGSGAVDSLGITVLPPPGFVPSSNEP